MAGHWLGGFAFFIVGVVVTLVGYGMWQNPHLEWSGFIKESGELFRSLAAEASRVIHDPFAGLGVVVMIGGVAVAVWGVRKLISR